MNTVKKGSLKTKIKRGDQVVFVSGKEYARYDADGNRQPFRGKVIAVDPVRGKVKIEGAQVVKKHQKAVPQLNKEGGIIEKESWVDISNIALIDPETGKPTRVKYEVRDGEKVRVAKSGKVIPNPDIKYRKTEKQETALKEEEK